MSPLTKAFLGVGAFWWRTLLVVSTLVVTVIAQESPSLHVPKFEYSVNHRTNVCERQRALWNNTVQLPNALQGLALTVVITNYQGYPNSNSYFSLTTANDVTTDELGMIRADDPGLFAVVLDEVARRAGFTWRQSFAAVPPLEASTDGNKTWTDILHWGVTTFDISMEKWGYSIDRLQRGISFPTGWWDSSIVLAETFQPNQRKQQVDKWSFLRPFSKTVWIMILATIVGVGLLYWYLEYLDIRSDAADLEEKPFAAVFLSALTFTGHFEFRPNTTAAQIVCLSFTFWALIVVSAYTANMASFLVTPIVAVFAVPTVQVAQAKGASLCVQKNAVIQSILEREYPTLNLLPTEGEANIFLNTRKPHEQGGCDAAAHQLNTFRMYQRDKNVNHDCSLASEQHVVKVIPAGMATAVDTGGFPNAKCTSLISHVLDYHLTKMKAEGFIEQAFKSHLNKIGTIQCLERAGPDAGGGFEDTFALRLSDVSGIFILHGICTAAAVTIAVVEFYRQRQLAPGGKYRTWGQVFGLSHLSKQPKKEHTGRKSTLSLSRHSETVPQSVLR